MRIFLDTNVLASGLATRGLCADVVRAVLEHHDLIVSDRMLLELQRVLRTKFRVSESQVSEFVSLLLQDALLAEELPLVDVQITDADDIPILSAARNARADFFVTGDTEVRSVGTIDSMKIMSPRQFWEEMGKA